MNITGDYCLFARFKEKLLYVNITLESALSWFAETRSLQDIVYTLNPLKNNEQFIITLKN